MSINCSSTTFCRNYDNPDSSVQSHIHLGPSHSTQSRPNIGGGGPNVVGTQAATIIKENGSCSLMFHRFHFETDSGSKSVSRVMGVRVQQSDFLRTSSSTSCGFHVPDGYLQNCGGPVVSFYAERTGSFSFGSESPSARNFFAGGLSNIRTGEDIGSSSAPGISAAPVGFNLTSQGLTLSTAGVSLNLNRNTVGSALSFKVKGFEIGRIDSSSGGPAFYTLSDRRVKSSIVDAPSLASIVKGLTVKSFTRNVAGVQSTEYGLIADELQAVYPGAVLGNQGDMEDIGTLTENDGTVIAVDVTEPPAEDLVRTESVPDPAYTVDINDDDYDPPLVQVQVYRTWTKTGERAKYQMVAESKLIIPILASLKEAFTKVEAVESNYATQAYVSTEIGNIVGSSPDTLNTLNELAAALGDDPNLSTTLTNAIAQKLDASAVSTFGLSLINDADAATAQATLGLGSASTANTADFATAAQGVTADAALPAVGAKAALSVDDLITLSGVAEGETTLSTFTGSTISDNSTVKAALQLLETGLEDLEVAVAEVDGNTDDLITLSGVAENSTNLGTFSGSIITDNSTVKVALQEVETAIVSAALIDGSNIPGPFNNDATASSAGVPVNGIYRNTNGTIHWRIS